MPTPLSVLEQEIVDCLDDVGSLTATQILERLTARASMGPWPAPDCVQVDSSVDRLHQRGLVSRDTDGRYRLSALGSASAQCEDCEGNGVNCYRHSDITNG